MSKKRRSKTLEKVARAVKDSDEFVEHIFGIARGFADHHELDAGAGSRGVRQALRVFNKHASALMEWFERSADRGTAEYEALAGLGKVSPESRAALGDVATTRAWL
ncbi:MAG TPA: hypothetical protein VKB34_15140, partial [Povalibacter sp.]|nr:hypothetical protein [Povalibacter sp.]